MRLHHVLLGSVAIAALALTGCPNTSIPENTISFTLDGVDYAFSVASDLSTHAYGQGSVAGSPPPVSYFLGAAATTADWDAESNIIEIFISTVDDYEIDVSISVGDDTFAQFDLGTCDRIMLENTFRNLDAVGEQMQAVFWGPYEYVNGSTHTLENLVISVERLEDEIIPVG